MSPTRSCPELSGSRRYSSRPQRPRFAEAARTDRTDMPIIFITGLGDVPITVQAMKAGAVEFLTKPFKDDELLSAIRQALERSKVALDQEAEIRGLRHRYASLSRREREVMALVVRGLLNKQVGFELGISEITVKAHRGQVMRKMNVGSLANLVNIAAKLRLEARRGRSAWRRRAALHGRPAARDVLHRDVYRAHL